MRKGSGAELARLFDEIVSLYLRLSAAASTIHGFGAMSGPRRTVLMTLARSGPQTVAHMARARAQSRQRVQPLINSLIADRLVAAHANPMHKRSPLMTLTPKGERAAKRIEETEGSLQAGFKLNHSPQALLRTATVIRDVRVAIEQQLPRLLRDRRRRSRRSD